ncbi:hypothetical protein [Yersinia enterocolitica]|uniref:hypothetical protein n=1 Tax=Yersinia enterocolitica TaxID=630 RepID=UPI003D78E311
MKELRAGGIALVIAGSPTLLGFTVTTERLIQPGELFRGSDGILSKNDIVRPKWLCTNPAITVKLADGTNTDGWALFNSEWLMPINGKDFSEENEKSKSRENSHA